jgi:hypothetical protein
MWAIRHLPLIFGGIGLLFFGTFGLLFSSVSRSGIAQITGIIISIILILTDLLAVASKKTRDKWFPVLLAIYSSGVLVMGLRPKPGNHISRQGVSKLLETSSFAWYDFIINVIGFIPLSFILIFVIGKLRRCPKSVSRFLLIILLCTAGSLFIEISQYFIDGRTSSLIDIAGNTLGAFLGGGYGLIYLALMNEDKSHW